MAETAVSTAAKWIGKLAEEAVYLEKVTGKMEKLQEELDWMLCFLQDADQQRLQTAMIRKWVSQIKEYAYDAEDLIDKYMLKVSRRTRDTSGNLMQMKTLVRCLYILHDWLALREVGSELDDLTNNLSELKEKLRGYGFSAYNRMDSTTMFLGEIRAEEDQRTYAQDPTENFIVGIDDDINILVNNMMDGEKIVMAIIGMGGLGKTTIARQVYKHFENGEEGRTTRRFVSFAWVHVSKKFRTDSVMETIVNGLGKGFEENGKVKSLKEDKNFKSAVHEVMMGRNCLVVIDDVWTSVDFSKLQAAFPKEGSKSGSRVLVTSRKDSIIQGWDSLVFVYKLKGLDREDILRLFNHKFGRRGGAEAYGGAKMRLLEEMLEHCGGVPLAVSALAAVLKRKESLEEWTAVRNNIRWYFEVEEDPNQPYKKVYDVLGMSYDDLPSHLKSCFLHLANFPEDYRIYTGVLSKLWLAEGLLELSSPNLVNDTRNNLRDADIAQAYLNELASRSMIMVEREPTTGWIKTCQLHDLMGDVCLKKATEEEGFLHQLKHIYATTDDDRSLRMRRLAVHMEHQSSSPTTDEPSSSSTATPTPAFPHLEQLITAPGLRSLIFFPVGERSSELTDCSPLVRQICKAFPLLRVMEFRDINISGTMPKIIGRMIHLRYLGLYGTSISTLPSSISNLKYLQTLDLRQGSGIAISLPNVLWMLKLLKHLYLPILRDMSAFGGSVDKAYQVQGGHKLRLDGLIHLETLTDVFLEDIQGLDSLNKIRSLKASYTGKFDDLCPFIESHNINDFHLTMHFRSLKDDSNCVLSRTKLTTAYIRVEEDDIGEPYATLGLGPRTFPQCITDLKFLFITFENDPMPLLGQLPNLSSLSYQSCFGCQNLKCSAGSFPNLTYLHLGRFLDLEWDVEDGALPRLTRIDIFNTNFVTRLPVTIPPSVWVICIPCVAGLETRDKPCPNGQTPEAAP